MGSSWAICRSCARGVSGAGAVPIVNAAIDGNDIVWHSDADIGIAISSPRGLVVPILRRAQTLSPAEIERAIADFGQRARETKLTLDDLSGGTFSITNGGVFGSLLSTPSSTRRNRPFSACMPSRSAPSLKTARWSYAR